MTEGVLTRRPAEPVEVPPGSTTRGRRRPWRAGPVPWLMPSVIVLLAVSLFPQIYALVNSLRFYNLGVDLDPRGFVGLDNYADALTDGTFMGSIGRTLLFAAGVTVVEVVLGVLLALLLRLNLPGTGIARSVLVMPVAIAPAVAGLAFRSMYDPATGLVPNVLSAIGIGTPESGLLGDPGTAILAVAVTDLWQWTPFVTLIVLAAMQGVPGEVVEAARMDGAGAVRVLWSIVLPLIGGALTTVAILRFIQSVNVFDIFYVQTRGGPGTSTTTLGLDIYFTGLSDYNIGLASAMTWIASVIVAVFVNVYLVVTNRRNA
jgi:multiple sugar transport system permease protein